MPSSYTSLLGFVQPATGELTNTWGSTVNTQLTQLVEDAIASASTKDVTAGDWTLTTTAGGAQNEARSAALIVTGTPGVTRNIYAPKQSKIYVVINNSNSSVVLKGGPSSPTTGVTVTAGGVSLIAWNSNTGDFTAAAAGVSSLTAGTGVSVSASTGAVTVTNTGVTSAVAGTGIGVSGATGAVTFTNSGVTSLTAGTGISVSASTGSVTISSTATASGANGQVFTSSGTFTIPTGVTAVKVTVVGGGGSSTRYVGCCLFAGNSGGTSSVSSGTQTISTISATGGAGGPATGNTPATGGLGSGGDLNSRGGTATVSGGNTLLSQGSYQTTALYGTGASSYGNTSGGGGGGAIKFLTSLTPGNTLTVTIGAGGTQSGNGAAGAAGTVVFEW